MAVSLNSLRRANHAKPPIILLHASHGVGKTTFAASAPEPVFICTEDGLVHDVFAFPKSESFAEVMDAIDSLAESSEHPFKTLVIDSLDWMEPLIWLHVCQVNRWPSIEAPGYGKGYVEALERWRDFIKKIKHLRDARGMAVVMIAHTHVKRFDAPDTEPYDRYIIKLKDTAASLLCEASDIVAFMNYRVSTVKTDAGFNKKIVRGVGSGMRGLYVEERPAFVAKNRYGMPEVIDLPDVSGNDPALWAALSQYLPQPAQEAV